VFDIKNKVDRIYDYQEINGIRDYVPQFKSPNEGLRRSITISRDALTENPLYNGSAYYFAVTAYAYNPASDPAFLESVKQIVQVIPQVPNIDFSIEQNTDDIAPVAQTSGDGHGQILPQVIDPGRLTGESYQVVFDSINGNLAWSLINKIRQDTLIKHSVNFTLDTTATKVYDGFKLQVQNQGKDSILYLPGSRKYAVKSVIQIRDGNGDLTDPIDVINNYSADGKWKITAYGNDSDIKQNINAPRSDAIDLDSYEIRFTTIEEGSEYYLYGYLPSFTGPVTKDAKAKDKVPFQVWNIGRDLESN
ncbi:MAG: hypothetical protein KDF60_20440, partial [Calditrichaeota bacterium]|nr:hypothetical protein [Calditrichota bacterium]